MKHLLFTLTLLFGLKSFSQEIEFLTLDSITKEPIQNVNFFNSKTFRGTISNENGIAKLLLSKDIIEISHIGYETRKILFNKKIDTLLMSAKAFELEEVVVSSFDLKKHLQYILTNINNLYNVSSKKYESTYKEKLKVNRKIARLSQVQIEWWNSNYNYDFKSDFESQNQIRVESLDYSKVLSNETILSNGGFIDNKQFFQYLFIGYYPNYIISYADNIIVESIEKSKSFTRVIFNADIIVNDKKISQLKKSEIFFDSKTKAISKLMLNIEYLPQKHKDFSIEKKIPYSSSLKKHTLNILFRNQDNKLIISAFNSIVNATVEYNNIIDELEIEQSIFITGLGGGKKFKKRDRVDLSLPLYTNFKTKRDPNNKIVLTKKEIAFIDE